ncbi:storkhead-box protein 2 isoform X1 [Vespula maculifrons]|uniref:Storkhead-box protein 2 isoform X1 n=1 Tax=Vespula maculifrons TaxID=7453 RepID=A0ABD2CJD5_VESMC
MVVREDEEAGSRFRTAEPHSSLQIMPIIDLDQTACERHKHYAKMLHKLHMYQYQRSYERILLPSFLEANSKCWWNAALVDATRQLRYKGHVSPGVLMVGGPPCALEVLRAAWARNVLRPPADHAITCLDAYALTISPHTKLILMHTCVSNYVESIPSIKKIRWLSWKTRDRISRYRLAHPMAKFQELYTVLFPNLSIRIGELDVGQSVFRSINHPMQSRMFGLIYKRLMRCVPRRHNVRSTLEIQILEESGEFGRSYFRILSSNDTRDSANAFGMSPGRRKEED